MKRWLLLTLALALLLAGCGNENPDTTTVPGGEPVSTETETQPPVRGTGLYDPNHALTDWTEGAILAYPLEDGTYTGIIPAEDGIVLMQDDYFGDTVLTRISGEEGVVTARRDLNTHIAFGNDSLRVVEGGALYYDEEDGTLVTLGEGFQEISRVVLPEDLMGLPVISWDGAEVYYHNGTQIRVLEMQTGISRLLRDQGETILELGGLYCGDTVLKIHVDDADEDMATQYLSTDNGETVHYGDDALSLVTYGDSFCAEIGSGYTAELLFGTIGGEVKLLEPCGSYLWTGWLPGLGGAVNCAFGDGTWTMNYYDLASGKRTGSVTMWDSGSAHGITEDKAGNIWFLYTDLDTREQTLCRWDLSRSAVSDDQVYTGRRYTADDPDIAGLAACKEEARRIGEAYGVEILLWQDALEVQPRDYSFLAEHQVSAVEQGLQALEKALGKFPEGFLRTAAEDSDAGKIRICLVGSIHGSREQGALPSTDVTQYWVGSDPYIALRLSGNVEMNFYHGVFHVIEPHVLGNTVTYDDWERLNPKGFAYDYDYIENLDRTDSEYLEGEDRAFVDLFAMSYPKEDRARIMEYAMTEGNEAVFESDWMQRKLLRLCRGIRKAFGLSKYAEVLPWETYLEESLVP